MTRLNKEQIAARRNRMQEDALKSLVKTEQLNVRIDEDSIKRLYAMAGTQGKPVGTMVREWLLERLRAEERPDQSQTLESLFNVVNGLSERFEKLEGMMRATRGKKMHPRS